MAEHFLSHPTSHYFSQWGVVSPEFKEISFQISLQTNQNRIESGHHIIIESHLHDSN